MRYPKLHEDVYVPTSLYLSHGRDDFIGGLAQIIKITDDGKDGINSIFVEIAERLGYGYNWKLLLDQQEELEKRYGNNRSYADPDNSPESNDPRW